VDYEIERKNELMKTIKHSDFQLLKDKILPKPNYLKLQTKIMNKNDFIGRT